MHRGNTVANTVHKQHCKVPCIKFKWQEIHHSYKDKFVDTVRSSEKAKIKAAKVYRKLVVQSGALITLHMYM